MDEMITILTDFVEDTYDEGKPDSLDIAVACDDLQDAYKRDLQDKPRLLRELICDVVGVQRTSTTDQVLEALKKIL